MEECRRRCTTVRQLELLLEFLEQHRDLALGRVRSKEGRAVSAQLWRECAEILNAEGPARTSKEWTKVWNNFKCTVRAKLLQRNANQQGTGGGPSTSIELTPLEDRAACILGRDLGPISDVRPNQFGFNTNDNTVEEIVDEPVINEINTPQLDSQSNIIFNVNEGDYQRSLHTPPLQETPIVAISPSLSGQIPSRINTAPRIRVQQRRRQRVNHSSVSAAEDHPLAQGSRTALDESRLMILRIETLRAEAALNNSQATLSLSESMKLVASSIEKFTVKYCNSGGETQEANN